MKETTVNTPEFIKLLTGFEQELRKEGLDEIACIAGHKDRLIEFFSYLETNGITTLMEINQLVVNDYMLYLKFVRVNKNDGGSLKEGTIKLHRNAIHKLWKYLHREGISANAIWIKLRKVNNKEAVVLTVKEIQQLYAVCNDTGFGYLDRAIIAIYYGCGMRKSEGEQLLLTDIDFNKGRIHIRDAKNSHERYVIMSPKVQQQIEEYVYHFRDLFREGLSDSNAFFISPKGTPYAERVLKGRLKRLWTKVKTRYGNDKEINLHTLRHSLGTHLYIAKMEIKDIAIMLGHLARSTTQIYIHLKHVLENEPV